ncbi:MAG: GTPase HflX, partial [Arenimonas sp.]|nr:GTPase HflX [Arenimonas sp.]
LRAERIGQVDQVLGEIGAGEIPQVLVFNKIDRIEGATARHDPVVEGRERIWLSARDGDGVPLLRDLLARRFVERRLRASLRVDASQGRLRARLHGAGGVASEVADEAGWLLALDLPWAAAERLAAEPGGHLLHALLLVAPGAPTYNRDID